MLNVWLRPRKTELRTTTTTWEYTFTHKQTLNSYETHKIIRTHATDMTEDNDKDKNETNTRHSHRHEGKDEDKDKTNDKKVNKQ